MKDALVRDPGVTVLPVIFSPGDRALVCTVCETPALSSERARPYWLVSFGTEVIGCICRACALPLGLKVW